MKYFFTLLFLLSSFGFAEDLSFLKVPKDEDPNTLYVLTGVNGCDTSKKELDKIVEGSLIRSRIKPERNVLTEPSLQVKLECLKISNNNPVFEITTRFGYWDYQKNKPVFFMSPYDKLGIGNKQYIETAVKDSVDEAMEEYIRANFMDD